LRYTTFRPTSVEGDADELMLRAPCTESNSSPFADQLKN